MACYFLMNGIQTWRARSYAAAIRGQEVWQFRGLSLLWLIHLPLCSLRYEQSKWFFLTTLILLKLPLLMKCSVIWVKFRDLLIELTYILRLPGSFRKLSEDHKESSVDIGRVTAAREIQTERFVQMENIHYNAQMNTKHQEYCALDDVSKQLLKTAMERIFC
jgi:hypothetical protein